MSQSIAPPLPRILPTEEIGPVAQRHVDEHRRVLDNITGSIKSSTASFTNVLGPIVELENLQSGEKAVISALRYAAVDITTQAAVEAAETLWLKYAAEVDQNLPFFKLLQAIDKNDESLDTESRRLLDRYLTRYTDCGYGVLDAAEIQLWHETNQEIEALCDQFKRNIRQFDGDTLGVSFTESELDGVPEHELDEYRLGADGKRFIPLRWHIYVSIIRHAHNPTTRKRIQLAWGQRIPQNLPIFRQIILLRHKNAQLRGFATHAAFRLPHRMAASIGWVEDLLEKLSKSLIRERKSHIERLEAKKRQSTEGDGISPANTIMTLDSWDLPYYNRLLDSGPEVDDKVMEYFPLIHTLHSLLDLLATYLQLRFQQLPREALAGHTWASEVEVWSVWDERRETSGAFVGYLYTDIFSRANKYKGSQAVNLQPGYIDRNGNRVYPVSTLMCNFSPVSRDGCLLLRHSQVITLFHELGHCIHDLLARTTYAKLHGYAVCLEFGEGIATMLENWCWIKDVLKSIGLHYTRVDGKYMEAEEHKPRS